MEYTYCDLDFKLAERYVRCVLSMNDIFIEAQGKSREVALSREGLVPVLLSEFNYKPFENYDEIRVELKDIYKQYATKLKNAIRQSYMLEQVQSVITLGDWIFGTHEFDFRELVQNALFVNHNKIAEHQFERESKYLNQLLSDKGYKGDLKQKQEAWKQAHLIQPGDLLNALETMAAETKRLALNAGFEEIADVDVKCVVEHDRPYSGYCDYPGRTIYINGDMEYTYPRLKHLMTHEVNPGHVTHMHIRKVDYEKGLVPADALLVITNTASSGIFEGLADNGQLFMGWDKEADDEIARVMGNIGSMASITAAHMLHEEHIPQDEVRRFFVDKTQATEAAADSKLRFLTFPHRKPFTYAYWRGNEAVRRIFLQLEKQEVWEFLRFAYHNMHSVNSIGQFLS